MQNGSRTFPKGLSRRAEGLELVAPVRSRLVTRESRRYMVSVVRDISSLVIDGISWITRSLGTIPSIAIHDGGIDFVSIGLGAGATTASVTVDGLPWAAGKVRVSQNCANIDLMP